MVRQHITSCHGGRYFLRIAFLNIYSLNRRFQELKYLIQNRSLDVICLSETRSISLPFIPGFKSISIRPGLDPRGCYFGGSGIYYKDHLKTITTDLPPDAALDEVATVTFDLTTTKLTVISVYSRPNDTLDIDTLEYIISHNQEILLLGDFNAHHPLLGSAKVNVSGQRLTQLINDSGLVILNNDQPTHFPVAHNYRPSRIDLMMTEFATTCRFANFDLDDSVSSDHRTIIIDYATTQTLSAAPRTHLDIQHADWDLFQEVLQENLLMEPINSPDEIDTALRNLSEAVDMASRRAIPVRNISSNLHYLTDKTKALITRRNRLRRQKARNPFDHGLSAEINLLTRRVHDMVRTDTNKFFRRLKRNINEAKSDPAQFWRLIRRTTGTSRKTQQYSLLSNGQPVTDDIEVAQIFANHLETVSQKPPEPAGTQFTDDVIDQHQAGNPEIYSNDFGQLVEPEIHINDINNLSTPISAAEYNMALKYTKDKTPGIDGIRTPFLKLGGLSLNQRLLEVFNECLRCGYFPPTWKHAIVRMIWKPGKDPSIVSSYRPISLLSIPGKLFERIISNRITSHIESSGYFANSQFGFRRRKRTTDALIRFSHDMAMALHHNDLFVPLLFDAEKAFDKVWTEGLMFKLTSSGIFPNRLLRLFNSFLTGRSFQIKVNTTLSRTALTSAGTPQGSVLSPMLFILYLNDLKECTTVPTVPLAQFADDIAVWTFEHTGRRVDLVENRLQLFLNKLMEYCKNNRFKINADKTQCMLGTRRRTIPEPSLYMDGTRIQLQTTIKYLGVTFSRKGDFHKHVDDLLTKANQRLGHLWKLRRDGIIPPKTILTVYKAIIRPIFEYAFPVWYGGVSKTHFKKILVFERKAIKLSYGLPKWTPTRYLYQTSKLEPINERLRRLSAAYLDNPDIPTDIIIDGTMDHRLRTHDFPVGKIFRM